MPFDVDTAVAELEEVLGEAQGLIGGRSPGLPAEEQAIALCRSAIERYTPKGSGYREQVNNLVKGKYSSFGVARALTGTLAALIRDFEKGRLRNFEELVHADLTGDLLGQAEELLRAGYKDPAMVIGGSVLEQHLRLLAERAEVSVFSGGRHKKAERLNAELSKAGAYGKTEQKSITAWLGRRNESAHGEYGNYVSDDVRLALAGIQAFVSQHPA